MRCFIALALPEEARLALSRTAASCREALEAEARSQEDRRPRISRSPRRISWSRAEGYHLTLAFLGEIEGAAVEAASEALEAASGIEAIGFRFAGLGGFPLGGAGGRGGDLRRAGHARGSDGGASADLWRVLFARLEDGGKCTAAYRVLNAALVEASLRRGIGPLNPEWRGGGGAGGRPFAPHVTLARAGDGSGIPGEALRRAGTELEGAWTIRRCALYKSELQRSGAVYTELRSVELGGGSASIGAQGRVRK